MHRQVCEQQNTFFKTGKCDLQITWISSGIASKSGLFFEGKGNTAPSVLTHQKPYRLGIEGVEFQIKK